MRDMYEKATPRPWHLYPKGREDIWPGIEGPDDSGVSIVIWGSREEPDDAGVRGDDGDMQSAEANAALIIHAVNNIEKLEQDNARLRAALDAQTKLAADLRDALIKHRTVFSAVPMSERQVIVYSKGSELIRSALNPHEGEKG